MVQRNAFQDIRRVGLQLQIPLLGIHKQKAFNPASGDFKRIFSDESTKFFPVFGNSIGFLQGLEVETNHLSVFQRLNVVATRFLLQKAGLVHFKLVFEEKMGIDFFAIHKIVHPEYPVVDECDFPADFPFFHKVRFGRDVSSAQGRLK